MTSDSRWYDKYHWTPEERVFYEKRFVPIIMHVLGCNLEDAWHEVMIWSGFGSVPSMLDKCYDERLYREYDWLNREAYKELRKELKNEN